MEVIWIALIAFAAFVGLSVVAGVAVVFFMRMRSRQPLNLNLRFLLRIYMLVVILAGMLVFTQGASSLLQAVFAVAASKEFSYDPVYVPFPQEAALRVQLPLERKDPDLLTAEERKELTEAQTEREEKRIEQEAERRRLGLDRALDEGLIEGVSFPLIGLVIWGSHYAGRRWLETPEERESLLSRVFLTLVTIIFGVITIVSLPQAVFETFRYVLLEPLDQFGRGYQPGGKLALAITSLPIWIIFLWETIRSMRRNLANGGPA